MKRDLRINCSHLNCRKRLKATGRDSFIRETEDINGKLIKLYTVELKCPKCEEMYLFNEERNIITRGYFKDEP